jgi:hypothetical protein
MSVRGKFQLQSSAEHYWSPMLRTLKFAAVSNNDTPENERFHRATPSGTIEMSVDNPAALEQFKVGDTYYIDFTPAPK